MSRNIKIGPGHHNIAMPGKGAPILNDGDTYTVSDEDFAMMQAAGAVGANAMIVDLGYIPDGGVATETDPVASAAVTAETTRATAAEQDAATNRAIGLTSFHYGDSLSIDPPIAGVHGKSWISLLQRELKLDKTNVYGIGGSDAIGIAYHVVNGSVGGFALPNPVGGSKWDGTRRGIVTLSCLVNDASATKDRSGGVIAESPIDAATTSGLVGAFRTILAVLASASRIEETAGALTGTWTNNGGSVFSNGASKYTTTPGDHIDFANVAFPASGRIHAILHSLDPVSLGTPPSVEIRVDGALVKTVSSATLTMRPQKTGASTSVNYAPCAIEIPGAQGAHSVTITHAGGAGQMMSVDCLLIPSPTPPPVIHLDEFNPPLPTGTPTRMANLAVLRPAYAAVAAEFPNVKQVPIVLDTGGFSTADTLHPNERGAIEMAVEVAAGIRAFLKTYNPDNLYIGLGAVTTPQFGQNIAPVAAWTLASNSNLRCATRQMVCISGGTVTAINIDGVPTGLTSGVFHIKPGHAISVTYTVAPNYSTWDIT